MAQPPPGRRVTFELKPFVAHDEEEEPSDKDSVDELLLESQPTVDTYEPPARPKPGANGRLKLWRRRRRRRPASVLGSLRPRQQWHQWKCSGFRSFWRWLKVLVIFILGIVTTILAVPSADYWPEPDPMDRAFGPYDPILSSDSYPSEYFRSILPIPCHSHNDYWRRRPLWSALCTGCVSIEADVWLLDGELYVGHTGGELEPNRTLAQMYIDPLVHLLEERNKPRGLAAVFPGGSRSNVHGVFFQDPEQSLTLLIDFKTDGLELWPVVLEALEPLRSRDWLTYWDGGSRITRPITVVGTGNTPFDLIVANSTYRDVFFDAPLNALATPGDEVTAEGFGRRDASGSTRAFYNYQYNPSNSYFASSSMTRALGPMWHYAFSTSQMDLMRKQIAQAQERGLVPRYRGTPRWPRGLRDAVWEVLIKENVGILNVDDLRAARSGTWGRWSQVNADVVEGVDDPMVQ